jgi:hypothetical protein
VYRVAELFGERISWNWECIGRVTGGTDQPENRHDADFNPLLRYASSMRSRIFAAGSLALWSLLVCTVRAQQIAPPAASPKDSLVLAADAYHAPVTLSLADFRALPHVNIKLHNPHNDADETYSGVPLAALLAKVNVPLGENLRGKALANYVVASGSDGYSVVVSIAELDPGIHDGQILVADARDGQPLGDMGPFRLIVSEDKRPARWVRNLVSISLQSVH